jgi:RNA polymerase sigma factor (sigma-70 family)
MRVIGPYLENPLHGLTAQVTLREKTDPESSLEKIATRWSSVGDPRKFLSRYERAIRNYLRAILKELDAVDEVFQDCVLKLLNRQFVKAKCDQGRFRFYLKRSVRNAAINYLREQRRQKHVDYDIAQLLATPKDESPEDVRFFSDWRDTLLQRSWRGLAEHERSSPESLCYTVLRLAADWPTESSAQLTERAVKMTGKQISVESFRKKLSRARHRFAEKLVLEVGQTLENPNLASVELELIDLDLIVYVRHILPGN